MAPKWVGPLSDIMRKVTNGLATRFCVKPKVTKKFLPDDIEQWGKPYRLEGGDITHVHGIVSRCIDGHNVSFIPCAWTNCQIFLKKKMFLSLPNSISNLLIKTSNIETFPKNSSYNHSSGNFCTLSPSPFPKAKNLKWKSLTTSTWLLFSKLRLFPPTWMGCCQFCLTHKLEPWTPLTSNPSSALSAMLRTTENGGWSTTVVCWCMRYLLRWSSWWWHDWPSLPWMHSLWESRCGFCLCSSFIVWYCHTLLSCTSSAHVPAFQTMPPSLSILLANYSLCPLPLVILFSKLQPRPSNIANAWVMRSQHMHLLGRELSPFESCLMWCSRCTSLQSSGLPGASSLLSFWQCWHSSGQMQGSWSPCTISLPALVTGPPARKVCWRVSCQPWWRLPFSPLRSTCWTKQ